MTSANVLVISEQPPDLLALRAALAGERRTGLTLFRLHEPALRMVDGTQRLSAGDVDVLIVNAAGAPDQALETVVRARSEAPHVPVVLLTDGSDAQAGIAGAALAAGAQDVLAREQLGAGILGRVLHYAVERQRLQETLRRLALSDPLTGLYTRRGLTALLEHHLKLVHRTRGLLIAAIRPELPPDVGAEHTPDAKELLRMSAVRVLQDTFRASDVLARLEGEAFAALVLDASEGASEPIAARLRVNLDRHNAAHTGPGSTLALAVHFTRIDPRVSMSAEEILARAIGA